MQKAESHPFSSNLTEFEHNQMWQKQFLKGMVEACPSWFWSFFFQLITKGSKMWMELQLQQAEGINDAFKKGWDLTTTILYDVRKEYQDEPETKAHPIPGS